MRLYSITNMYTDGIHAGIQTQHSTGEVFLKYHEHVNSNQFKETIEWLRDHKTTVILNGGMHDNLMNLLDKFNSWEQAYPEDSVPFAPFFEPGINNALTSIAVVFKQDAIDFMSGIRALKPRKPDVTDPEWENLKEQIFAAYGPHALDILESIAFLPLAK